MSIYSRPNMKIFSPPSLLSPLSSLLSTFKTDLMSSELPIKILLVEDHALMRRGMKGQFALEPGFTVIGEAVDGSEAIKLAAQLQPDVVLMDIDLPVMDGISATQRIKSDRTNTRILALSAFDNDTQVMGMLAAGADGYCLKSIEWEQLISVINIIQGGGAYLDPAVARKVARMLKPAATPPTPQPEEIPKPLLSSREREILKLIADGCSNQVIAEKLFLSLGTVKSYVRMILNKLSVDDRVQAAAKAVREGLI
jgi:NarL family two-component system response regulator LiaR